MFYLRWSWVLLLLTHWPQNWLKIKPIPNYSISCKLSLSLIINFLPGSVFERKLGRRMDILWCLSPCWTLLRLAGPLCSEVRKLRMLYTGLPIHLRPFHMVLGVGDPPRTVGGTDGPWVPVHKDPACLHILDTDWDPSWAKDPVPWQVQQLLVASCLSGLHVSAYV